MLTAIARLALRAPRRILAAVLLVMVGAAVFGIPVGSESSKATAPLLEKSGQAATSVVFTVTSNLPLSPTARTVGLDIVAALQNSPYVTAVQSAWTVPPQAAGPFVSTDGRTGLIIASLSGSSADAHIEADRLAQEFSRDRRGVAVRAGGEAVVDNSVDAGVHRGLMLMVAIAVPLSFVVLVWMFGGVVAAALPLVVGAFAIPGSMAAMRATAVFTDVSTFALTVGVAMGLALAGAYSLLILSRFRDELADGRSRDDALVVTMATAGRTVVFSALTVALTMATLAIFPQSVLTSLAYCGVAAVGVAVAAAVVVTPAAIVVLGPRLDALEVRPRRAEHRLVEERFWYRWTTGVLHRAVPIGMAVTVVLVLVGAPLLNVRWGFPDDRVLPTSASAREVGDIMRARFPDSAVPPPDDRPAQLTGPAAANRDGVRAIATRLPLVLALVVAITLSLVFASTGSVTLPLAAIVASTLSLAAPFGALVWIFQEGHLGGLGTTATGALDVQLLAPLSVIAFGLSTGCQIVLLSRIRECWLESHRGWGASDKSIALGVAYTGRVVTAAALVMVTVFAALTVARVSPLRLVGFGLAVTVLIDATLVRMLLVPVFVKVLGARSRWAPPLLSRPRQRPALRE